jgi:hypothetical protein
MGNHAVASSSQAISFVGSQHPDHTTQAGVVAQTTNGIISNVHFQHIIILYCV